MTQYPTTTSEPVPAIGPAMKFASHEFVRHFIIIFSSVLVVSFVGQLLVCWLPNGFKQIVTIVFPPLWTSFFMGGLISILLSLTNGEEPSFSMLFSKAGTFWKYWIAQWVFGIAVAISLLFLIVPGIFLSIRLGFYMPAMAERNLGIFESFEESWKITDGCFWRLFLFGLTFFGIFIIPLIILVIMAVIASMVLTQVADKAIAGVVAELLISFGGSIMMTFYWPAWIHCYKQVSLKTTSVSPLQLQG